MNLQDIFNEFRNQITLNHVTYEDKYEVVYEVTYDVRYAVV